MDEVALRIGMDLVQNIIIGEGVIEDLQALVNKYLGFPDSVYTVVDSQVLLANRRVSSVLDVESANILVVGSGEHIKNFEWLLNIIEKLYAMGMSRKSLLLAAGGGSLLDTMGFAASIYMRGVPHATIPSTLLAMVDAGIGGKNGVNFMGRKNMLGCIRPPSLTIVDPIVLESLPVENYLEGLSEVVKHALLDSWERLEWLLSNKNPILARDPNVLEQLLSWNINVKKRIVEKDPLEEKGERSLLNLGHTIGHALEAASNSRISHGEAIAIGLYQEALLARDLGYASMETPDIVRETLESLGLPIESPIPLETLASYIGADKKRIGDKLRMPILIEPGKVKLEWVSLDTLKAWLKHSSKSSA